ncbi:hypothetical protein [Stackebrandtia soli]|uniref:hypothetical protein n=1 Tax=Stackebrandtia soli TaxID=1892856 RepID=UPI0039E855D5
MENPKVPKTWAEVRALPDDELVRLYDWKAETTATGLSFYRDELRHREEMRFIAEAQRASRRAARYTTASFWVAVVAALIALAAVLFG